MSRKPPLGVLWAALAVIGLVVLYLLGAAVFGDSSPAPEPKPKVVATPVQSASNPEGLGVVLKGNMLTLDLDTDQPVPQDPELAQAACGYGDSDDPTLALGVVEAKPNVYQYKLRLSDDLEGKAEWCGIQWPQQTQVPGRYVSFPLLPKATVSGSNSDAKATLNGQELTIELNEGPGAVLQQLYQGKPVRVDCGFSAGQNQVISSTTLQWTDPKTTVELPIALSGRATYCSLQLLGGPSYNNTLIEFD